MDTNNRTTAAVSAPVPAPKPKGDPTRRLQGGGGGAGGGRGRGGGVGSVAAAAAATAAAAGGRGVGGAGGAGKKPQEAHQKHSQKKPRGAWGHSLVNLHDAIAKAPVLVKLDEGHRGPQEELSLSAGDTLGLEGVTEKEGRRVVMAYYVSDSSTDAENEEEQGTRTTGRREPGGRREDGQAEKEEEETEVCRALLLLPYDSLPSLDVRVWEGEENIAYQNFLGCHFSHCNWLLQREDLLKRMGNNNYINVSTILVATDPSRRELKEQWSPTRSDPGGGRGDADGNQAPVPPRPKRAPLPPPLGAASHHRSEPSTPTTSISPPPRPPRRSSEEGVKGQLPPRRHPKSERPPEREGGAREGEEEEEGQEAEGGGEVFAWPSLAEMYSSGALRLEPGDRMRDSLTFKPPSDLRVQLPERARDGKDKKKPSPLKKAAKTLGIKIYQGLGKINSKSHQSFSIDTSPTTRTSPFPVGDEPPDDYSDDDEDVYYTMIDESMMDPVYVKQSLPSKAKAAGEAEQGQTRKGDKPRAGCPTTKAAMVKPTVRVAPQGTQHTLMMSKSTSQSTSSTSKTPTGKTSVPHLMMLPKDGSVPESNPYEAKEEPKLVTSPLKNMTCADLCNRLRQCGMSELAHICQENSIDGTFFLSLSDEALTKPPFCLANFQVDTKLKMVKAGWVPK